MAFKKGASGNPGGRPKVEGEIREIAQLNGPAAIRRLVQLMNDRDKRVALAACNAILDRGYGRPQQAIQVKDDYDMKERFLATLLEARERHLRMRRELEERNRTALAATL